MRICVYVLNKRGQALMPTNPCKAKKLLRVGAARVVRRTPFTIQLNHITKEYKQPIALGIDSGYANIGFSAITKKNELISGEVKLDNRMSKRLLNRAMYRKGKRRRNTRYRKARFNNRISSKKQGWLPPSIQRRLDTHVKIINYIKSILPISKTIIEVANFDIQKLQNPNIHGEDYQRGNLYEYHNLKSYIVAREKGKCQLCGKEKGKNTWNLHHVEQRSQSGSNTVSNMALLHNRCHKKLHKQNLGNKLKKSKTYKQSTFMNIIKKRLTTVANEVTFGYKTYLDRTKLGLEKSHNNDAFIISNGSVQSRSNSYSIIQKRRNNRCLQKNRNGFKPSIRRQRYSLQPLDLVKYEGRDYRVIGIHSYGKQVKLVGGDNSLISKSTKKVSPVKHEGSFVW